jgi:hypothetical protein
MIPFQFLICRSNHPNFRNEDTMCKTAITLPEKIRSKSVATLLASLVALTALSVMPLTASAGTPQGSGVTVGEIRHVVAKYLTEHPELLRQAAPAPHGIYVGDSEHQQP